MWCGQEGWQADRDITAIEQDIKVRQFLQFISLCTTFNYNYYSDLVHVIHVVIREIQRYQMCVIMSMVRPEVSPPWPWNKDAYPQGMWSLNIPPRSLSSLAKGAAWAPTNFLTKCEGDSWGSWGWLQQQLPHFPSLLDSSLFSSNVSPAKWSRGWNPVLSTALTAVWISPHSLSLSSLFVTNVLENIEWINQIDWNLLLWSLPYPWITRSFNSLTQLSS